LSFECSRIFEAFGIIKRHLPICLILATALNHEKHYIFFSNHPAFWLEDYLFNTQVDYSILHIKTGLKYNIFYLLICFDDDDDDDDDDSYLRLVV